MHLNEIDIVVKDSTENESVEIKNTILSMIEQFDFLDLRRFEKIIVAEDVNTEVNQILNSNNEQNSSILAKVITSSNNEKMKLLLILNREFLDMCTKLTGNEPKYNEFLHILHHELAHIHDYNKKIDVFESYMLHGKYNGVKTITYPLAEICWSEYIANFISSSSTSINSYPVLTAEILAELVIKMTNESKVNIQVFKSNKNRMDLFHEIKEQIEKVVKTAAYLLGYLHGLNVTLPEISDKIDYMISKSNFSETWKLMNQELHLMRSLYPLGWQRLRIYENLAYYFQNYYKENGLFLKENEKKELYFSIA